MSFLKSTNYKSKKRRRKKKKKRERDVQTLLLLLFKAILSALCWQGAVSAEEESTVPAPYSLPSLSALAPRSLSLSPTDRHTERFQMFQLRRLHAAPRARREEPPDLI